MPSFKTALDAARTGAAFARVPAPGLLEVRGKGRAAFLHGLLSADIKSLETGRGALSCLLTAQGKITALLGVYALEDHHLLVSPPACAGAAATVLSRMAPLADCEVQDATGSRDAWLLVGPRRAVVLEALGARPCDPGPDGVRTAATSSGTLLALSDFLAGPDSILILAAPGGGERLDGALRGACDAVGALELPGPALESLRLQAGMPAWGAEAGADCFPQELGLARAVHPAKGCYLGQEIMARLKDRGHVNRRLCLLSLPSPAAPGDAVESSGGETLGRLGSVAPSLSGPGTMALAVLKDAGLAKGGLLRVRAGAQVLEAVLPEGPL